MQCTVKKTFEAARDSGNALIAQVKGNQQGLLDAIEAVAAADQPIDSDETVQRNRHGRQEHRLVETFDLDGRLGPGWRDLISSAVRVTRLTWHKDTKTGLWHDSFEVSFYASQIALSAKQSGAAIRQHWAIENKNHHVRDVSFFEDHSRIRIKPGHFARFRTFALNILRANGAKNIAQELYINALSPHNPLSYHVT